MIRFTSDIHNLVEEVKISHPESRVFVLTDANTAHVFLNHCRDHSDLKNLCTVGSGEAFKTLTTAEAVWNFLARNKADRQSILINFGGGMITDLGGFCASTFMRGIRCINVRTSLLAMVDAAVGGKTGVNFEHLKNYIGTFQEPEEVIIFPGVLKSLPIEELKNGWAEVIKHGIIEGSELWAYCKNGIPPLTNLEVWQRIIQLNLELKSSITQRDPFEKGPRKTLNLGHSVAHAIESRMLTLHAEIKHGFAVAAGLLCEAWIAEEAGIADSGFVSEISVIIKRDFPHIQIPGPAEEIVQLVLKDKKNRDGQILMALPRQAGNVEFDFDVSETQIHNALNKYAAVGSY